MEIRERRAAIKKYNSHDQMISEWDNYHIDRLV